MTQAAPTEHHAEVLDTQQPADAARIARLREDPGVVVVDELARIEESFRLLHPPPTAAELAEPARWVHYPWRRTLVRLPGPQAFARLRLDRNRNKITSAEQDRLRQLRIGVVGLSVGHSVAHTLALEGLCGALRLADFDLLELSNLNRIPATVLDLGVNKAVVVARRIAELDPYLPVEVEPDGITAQNLAAFFDGLDLVVEECDSLDVKVMVRQEARKRGIPVLMETSDRGMFDAERFDRERDRPLFHGLLGEVDPAELRGLSTRDKAPHVMRIIDATQMSARMSASMVEVDRTITTWPQLGGDVQLGAATVAAAVRRLGTGRALDSGRVRIDLDAVLDRLGEPPTSNGYDPAVPVEDLTTQQPAGDVETVVRAIRLAPSGGNVQPWSIGVRPDGVDIFLAPERTSAMDVAYRGSLVAIGAGAFNARVAAAWSGSLGRLNLLPSGDPLVGPVVSLDWGRDRDPDLSALYPDMVQRMTNRHLTSPRELDPRLAERLTAAAAAEGGGLRLVTDRDRMWRIGEVLAGSDRIRYLSPLLHRQMMSELSWPGIDRLDLGIDVRTLGLDAADLAKLQVAARPEVMTHLREWGGGDALGDDARDRVAASSAIAVVTVGGDTALDYLRGGAALGRMWATAQAAGLGVQPTSPVFLYARSQADLDGLSSEFSAELGRLRSELSEIAELDDDVPVLVLRLSHDVPGALRSARLKLEDVMVHAAVPQPREGDPSR